MAIAFLGAFWSVRSFVKVRRLLVALPAMKDPSRALKVSVIAAFAVSLATAAVGCGSMGRAGDQVDRSASKVGKVFKK